MATPYEIITDRIVAALEAGVVPWHRPWTTAGGPANGLSGRPYRGINAFLTGCQGYGSRYWLTFRQVQQLGGRVVKGQKATPVVFWKVGQYLVEDPETGERVSRNSFLLRYYNVFNLEQTEGVTLPKGREAVPVAHDVDPIEAAEAIVAGMPKAPTIEHGGDVASYSPSQDRVAMPKLERFESAAYYYGTLFHELTHATGHPSRLDRGLNGSFGSDPYAREELVAEMGSAFLVAEAGISADVFRNSVAYLESWVRCLKGNPKLVVIAAAQAQKAADFILGRSVATEEAEEVAAAA